MPQRSDAVKKITFCVDDELYNAFDAWLHTYKQATGYKASKTQVLIALLKAMLDLKAEDVKTEIAGDSYGK